MKIVLATPHKRYDALEAVLREKHGFEVVRVRGKEELTNARLSNIKPSYVFFPHWSWIVPKDVHEQFNCVIFHMTDVPFGRGGSPLQNLIVRKIYETKLSAIKCAARLDAGPVYLKMPLSLQGSAEEIFARAALLMEDMVVKIAKENIVPVPQTGEPVMFERRKPEDSNLAPVKDLNSVHDMIRMLDAEGYPHAFLSIGGIRYEFSNSQLRDGQLLANVKITAEKGAA